MAAITRLCALAVCLVAAGSLVANPANAACEDANTTIELGQCLVEELATADTDLNRVWGLVRQSIQASDHVPAEERKVWADVLLEAQRAWIRLKDTDCGEAVPFEWYGGTGASNAATMCKLTMTLERTSDLKARYGID